MFNRRVEMKKQDFMEGVLKKEEKDKTCEALG